MSLHAIFRFENLDSTRDLNSRFEGLFKRGIYDGGIVELAGASVKLSKFKAITEDGMAVISDEDIIIPVPSTRNSYYIVLNAKYVMDGDPIIEVKAVEVTAIGNYENPVKFAVVSGNQVHTNSTDYRDTIDPVGKNYYKGQVLSSELPQGDAMKDLVAGEWFFVKEGDNYKITLFNGADYSSFEPITELSNEFINHRKNNIKDIPDSLVNDAKGYWKHPTISSVLSDKLSEEFAKSPESQEYGSYHISINKWFAEESITRKWTKESVTTDWSHTELTPSKCSEYATLLQGFGASWTSDNLVINLNQLPSNDNKFVTQNYPLIPTVAEKYAIAGNLTRIKESGTIKYPVGINNKLVTQKTAGVSIQAVPVTSSITEKVGDYYYYNLNSGMTEAHIYAGSGNTSESWSRYFRFTEANTASKTPGLSSTSFTICTKSSGNYTEITSANFVPLSASDRCAGRGFLINNTSYYLRSPIELTGNIYYYVESDIDAMDYAYIGESIYRNRLRVLSLYVDKLFLNDNTSSYICGTDDNIKVSLASGSKFKILGDVEVTGSVMIHSSTTLNNLHVSTDAVFEGSLETRSVFYAHGTDSAKYILENTKIGSDYSLDFKYTNGSSTSASTLVSIGQHKSSLSGAISLYSSSGNKGTLYMNNAGDLKFVAPNNIEYTVFLVK